MKTKMTDEEANEYRCYASEIVIKLMEAKKLDQLELLAAHADSAIDSLKGETP